MNVIITSKRGFWLTSVFLEAIIKAIIFLSENVTCIKDYYIYGCSLKVVVS